VNDMPTSAGARGPRRALIATAALLAALVAALLLWRFGPWRAGSGVPKDLALQTVGRYQIGVAIAPDPPRVGENTMTIVLRDASGAPVRGATLTPVVSMPAMGAMPYMESRGTVTEAGSGLYRARYGLSMGGDWDARIGIRASAGDAEAAYRLSTSLPGAAFDSGTPVPNTRVPIASGAAAESSAAAGVLPGAIALDAARRQALGVRTATVGVQNLSLRIRSSGRVAYDEARQVDVSLKYAGWVRGLAADFIGRPVRRGEVLFTAYSPELIAAQQEYLQALGDAGRDTTHTGMSMGRDDLAAAARQRLLRWDVPEGTLDDLARTRRPREAVPVLSPATGVVVEKNVVDGSPFSAGQVLFRIASIDPAWVVASVFQGDLAHLRVGVPARIADPFGASPRKGRVAFISPAIDSDTRAGQVRIEVPNADGALKPGAFVDVEFDAPLGRRLAIPESAVLPTGERSVVFVDLGDGRIAPRTVDLGARAGDWYEVRSGLKAGEVVVTSGNFLIAAESKLRSVEEGR